MDVVKRNLVLLFFVMVLIAATCAFMKGQVLIGDPLVGSDPSSPVQAGVNLQLDGTKGGLLLPQVEITSLSALPESIVNPTPAPATPVDPTLLGGLLVYNKTAAIDTATSAVIPTGVYYWDSGALSWKLLSEVG